MDVAEAVTEAVVVVATFRVILAVKVPQRPDAVTV
jgi:hypothetical protein